jgi:hypothetical protein
MFYELNRGTKLFGHSGENIHNTVNQIQFLRRPLAKHISSIYLSDYLLVQDSLTRIDRRMAQIARFLGEAQTRDQRSAALDAFNREQITRNPLGIYQGSPRSSRALTKDWSGWGRSPLGTGSNSRRI